MYEDLSFPLDVKICQSKEVNAVKTPSLQIMLITLSGDLDDGKHAGTVIAGIFKSFM